MLNLFMNTIQAQGGATMFKMRWMALFILTSGLFLLTGCGETADEVRVDDRNQGQQIEVEIGQILVVSLVSNPTTGYSWQVSENDETILAPQGEVNYQADPQSEGLVGSGGTETFRFKAEKSGRVNLELIYHRPWEQDVDPLQVYTIDVVVP